MCTFLGGIVKKKFKIIAAAAVIGLALLVGSMTGSSNPASAGGSSSTPRVNIVQGHNYFKLEVITLRSCSSPQGSKAYEVYSQRYESLAAKVRAKLNPLYDAPVGSFMIARAQVCGDPVG